MGKPGVEQCLQKSDTETPIMIIKFDVNRPRLIGLDADQNLILWNLETGNLDISVHMKSLSNESSVSSMCLTPFSRYLWVGFENGRTLAYEIETLNETDYRIEFDEKNLEKLKEIYEKKVFLSKNRETTTTKDQDLNFMEDRTVVDIQIHSSDFSKVLIGYANNLLVLFNLRRERIEKTWILNEKCKLCSFCWNPDGTYIAAGYSHGKIAIWDVKTLYKPKYLRNVNLKEELEHKVLLPISKIVWCSMGDDPRESILLITGGTNEYEPNSLLLHQFFDTNLDSIKRSHLFRFDLADFLVLNDTISYNGCGDSSMLVVLTSDGHFETVDLRHKDYPSTWLPSSLSLMKSQIRYFKLYRIDDSHLYDLLRHICSVSHIEVPLALCGGGFSDRTAISERTVILMITEDQTLQLWDTSYRYLEQLWSVSLESLKQYQIEEDDEICSIDLCTATMYIVMGLKSGALFLFKLINESRDSKDSASKVRDHHQESTSL